MLGLLDNFLFSKASKAIILASRRRPSETVRHFTGKVDEPKLTKSDEVKFHSVHHFAVEKTPITAQLWMQRLKAHDSPSLSSQSATNSYMSKETIGIERVPAFLLDKTSKESRLTVRYDFSKDGEFFVPYYLNADNRVIGHRLYYIHYPSSKVYVQ